MTGVTAAKDQGMFSEPGLSEPVTRVPLEVDPETRRLWLASASDFVDRLLDDLAHAPAMGPDRAATLAALARLDATPQEQPRSLDDALSWLSDAGSLGLQTSGPGYMAYVPGGGLLGSAIAGLVSLAMNRFTALAAASPGLARLEHALIDFFCREVGYPDTSSGVLTSGGSLANLSAIVTARQNRLGDDGDLRFAYIYTSREAHRSVAKAARLAGIPPANLREIPVDTRLRLDVGALERALEADRGGRPFMIVASAGTTNVGAIDPLCAIADVAERHHLWLHVDGAYGGAFILTPEGKTKLSGLDRADSITLDPHKGLFLPYGTGCLLVRSHAALEAAHSESAGYLRDLMDGGDGTRSSSSLSPELSRNDRAVLLWLPFWLHGVGEFRRALSEKLALVAKLRESLRQLPLEVPLEPELSIAAFRLPRRRDEPLDSWNARNGRLLSAINDRRRIHLSSTLLPTPIGPAATLRVCILSFRTGASQVDHAIADIAAATAEAWGP